MQIQGITWHAVVLEAGEFAATKKLVTEVFGLTSLIEQDGWALFPMSNGTILDLYAPVHVPAYGFNDGIVFGFRVDDVEAASAELAGGGMRASWRDHAHRGDEVSPSGTSRAPTGASTASTKQKYGDCEEAFEELAGPITRRQVIRPGGTDGAAGNRMRARVHPRNGGNALSGVCTGRLNA